MARGFRGVKDDLSEIGRHLLDIACFLHPLLASAATLTDSPPSSPHSQPPPPPPPAKRVITGAIGDLAEIGGTFRSGLSRLSTALKSSPRAGGADGSRSPRGREVVREEVLEFVRDLVKCPESWIEFPVPVDEDFDVSCHQREHIIAVERMAPSLATLRVSLCPSDMSEETFWKIYFALLHPRLNKHEVELLSTQQIVEEMRINLKKKMQNRVQNESLNPPGDNSATPTERFPSVAVTARNETTEIEEEDPRITEATPQYIDRWFEMSSAFITREADASSNTDKQYKRRGEEYYSEADDDANVILLRRYASSSSIEAAGELSSSSYEHLHFRKRPDSFSYHGKERRRPMRDKESTDEEPGEWQAVEDSDFEILDKS